jgi:hypothetical protein
MNMDPPVLHYRPFVQQDPIVFQHVTADGTKRYLSITRIDETFTRVNGWNPDTEETTHLDEHYTMSSIDGATARKVQGTFSVSCLDTYTIQYDGVDIIVFQKISQQAVHGKNGCVLSSQT